MIKKKRYVYLVVLGLIVLGAGFLLIKGFGGLTGFVIFEQNNQQNFSGGTYANTMHNGNGIVIDFETDVDSNTLALWHFDEIAGTNLFDSGINGLNGTSQSENWVAGKINNSYDFNGSDDYVLIQDDPGFDILEPITIEFWINPDDIINDQRVFNRRNWVEVKIKDNDLEFRWKNENPGDLKPTATLSGTGTWIHVASTVSGNSAELYINGVLVDTDTDDDFDLRLVDEPLYFGVSHNIDKDYSGLIDEVKISNISKSATKIDEIFKGNYTSEVIDVGQISTWNNISWTNNSLGILNLSVRSCDDGSCSGETWSDINGTSPGNLSLTDNRYFQYRFDFEAVAGESPEVSSVLIDYDSIASAPSVNILLPVEGETLTTNESLSLNFTVTGISLDACWYTLDSGATNTSLSNCANTTFSVSGSGSYIVFVYANESVSGLEGVANSSFDVQLAGPVVSLSSPEDNGYLNYNEISFVYNVSDNGAPTDSCGLWGNFAGTFELNQTDSNVSVGELNSFSLNLSSESVYNWNVQCNDTSNALGLSSSNYTFQLDLTQPDVDLESPNGTYNVSQTIPVNYTVEDTSPIDTCTYDLVVSVGGQQIEVGVAIEGCGNTSIVISGEDNYDLTVTANDSAGNSGEDQSSFAVGGGGSGGGGGGSGGGGGNSNRGVVSIGLEDYRLEFSDLDVLEIGRGETETLELKVENIGSRFLNSCKFRASGGVENWISNSQAENIGSGQIVNYIFSVNTPVDIEPSTYYTALIVECTEMSQAITLNIDVIVGNFAFLILNSEKVGNKLRIDYALENFDDDSDDFSIKYSLVNSEGVSATEGEESVSIDGNTREELSFEFELPKDSVGNFDIVLDVSDGRNSERYEQRVILAGGLLTGLAISDENLRFISWGGVAFIFLVALYFVIKFLYKHDKKHNRQSKKRHFIKIDLKN
jgi:hypothetical protein